MYGRLAGQGKARQGKAKHGKPCSQGRDARQGRQPGLG